MTLREKSKAFWQYVASEEGSRMAQTFKTEEYVSTREEEAVETMTLIPDIKDKVVLELGAGSGRFTGRLADKARKVIAVDFIPERLEKNKATNHSNKNVDFILKDVMDLDLQENSVDVVFASILFCFLDEEEIRKLCTNFLSFLKPNGFIFFREVCFKSPKVNIEKNPSVYRDLGTYCSLLQSISTKQHGKGFGFEIISTKSLQTYLKMNDPYQIVYLAQKSTLSDNYHGFDTFQAFLDNQQYSRNGILRYEKIFGDTFVSTGGIETTKTFVDMLNLKPGQYVYDVGCGIGGSAFYMADKFGVRVLGVDLSCNMISLAYERAENRTDTKVEFEVADVTKMDYGDETFDVIYSRDTILHIPDKRTLFTNFLRMLKPGGKLLISDYCCSPGEHSEAYKKYVKQRGYTPLSPQSYGKLLEEVGFKKVLAEDKTDLFVEVLKNELKRTEAIKDTFIKEFCQKDYDDIVTGWKDKLVRCAAGDQRWGLFYAEKL